MKRKNHRRTQSDFVETQPNSVILLDQNAISHKISNPSSADNDKLHEYSLQKLSTIQQMVSKASLQYEELKLLYEKNQSDQNQLNLENQRIIVTNLLKQLSKQESEMPPPLSTNVPISYLDLRRRKSFIEASSSSLDEKNPNSALPPHPPSILQGIKSKGNRLWMLGAKKEKKENSQLMRSHSDSYKKDKILTEELNPLRPTQSIDALNKLTELEMMRASFGRELSRSESKSQDGTSDYTSDSTGEPLHPLTEETSPSSYATYSDTSLSGPSSNLPILTFDDDCEKELIELDPNGPFSDFELLKNHPAHVAIFLDYVISNNDPAPVFFCLISDLYASLSSPKDLKRCAFEIFTSFLSETAPLKVMIDQPIFEKIALQIVEILQKHDKEERLLSIFNEARVFVLKMTNDILFDFRNKISMGLGNIFGYDKLSKATDHKSHLRIVEEHLVKHISSLLDEEESERTLILCSAILTFMKSVNFQSTKFSSWLDRCPTFVTKEKHKFPALIKSNKKNSHNINLLDHNFNVQQYFSLVNCSICQNLFCTLGYQGLQCQRCELNIHKTCWNSLKETCTGKKPNSTQRAKTTPIVLIDKIRKKPTKPGQLSDTNLSRAVSMPSVHEPKGITHSKSSRVSFIFKDKEKESLKDQMLKPNEINKINEVVNNTSSPDSIDNISDSVNMDNNHYPKGLTTQLSSCSIFSSDLPSHFIDSDFEVEIDLPPLENIIPPETLKKLKSRERKRQNIINELLYTERAHMRNLKVMQRVFHSRMRSEYDSKFIQMLFPNLDKLIEIHGNLNNDLKKRVKESKHQLIEKISDILEHHFTNEVGNTFKITCAIFCQKQSHALEMLKSKQKKDPKLAAFLQEASNNALCRRLELKDLLPSAMQRLTKYPLLISNILKYTTVDSTEYNQLNAALVGSREVLTHVNKSVQLYENQLKLGDIQKRLDRKSLENTPIFDEYKNLDLVQHALIHDGALTWRIGQDRLIPLHVVLLEDIILLIQKLQDEKLILKYQYKSFRPTKEDSKWSYSPIVKIDNLLIKPVATDKLGFFLIQTKDTAGPLIYQFMATNHEDKERWFTKINEAIETYKIKNPDTHKIQSKPENSKSLNSNTSSLPISAYFSTSIDAIDKKLNVNINEVSNLDEQSHSTFEILKLQLEHLKSVDLMIEKLVIEKQKLSNSQNNQSILNPLKNDENGFSEDPKSLIISMIDRLRLYNSLQSPQLSDGEMKDEYSTDEIILFSIYQEKELQKMLNLVLKNESISSKKSFKEVVNTEEFINKEISFDADDAIVDEDLYSKKKKVPTATLR